MTRIQGAVTPPTRLGGVLPRRLRPRYPAYLVATAVAAALVLFAVAVRPLLTARPLSAGDGFGLTFGFLAALLMVLVSLYSFRRRLMVGPLRSAQLWLQLHVYAASLAAVLVLAHMGFRLPAGLFGWILFGLTLWATLSGILGVLLQKTLPGLLAGTLRVEAIYERIPELLEELRAQARRAAADAPEVVQRFHATEVEPLLAGVSASWFTPFGSESAARGRAAAFERLDSFVTDADRGRVAELKRVVATKTELDAHYNVQRLLRVWPLLHVPPAIALLAAILAHVVAVWYF